MPPQKRTAREKRREQMKLEQGEYCLMHDTFQTEYGEFLSHMQFHMDLEDAGTINNAWDGWG
jgi:hypothetical protein